MGRNTSDTQKEEVRKYECLFTCCSPLKGPEKVAGQTNYLSLAFFDLAHQSLPFVIQGSFLAPQEAVEVIFVVNESW